MLEHFSSAFRIRNDQPEGREDPQDGCLVRRGFRDDEIMKILGGNFLRLPKAVLKPRARMSTLALPGADDPAPSAPVRAVR